MRKILEVGLTILALATILLFCCGNVLAQEQPVTYLQKGSVVSFDAMCFTLPAAVKLKVDLEYCGKEQEILCDKKLQLLSSEDNLRLQERTIFYEGSIAKLESELDSQDEEIDFLNEQISEIVDNGSPWYKEPELWFAIGAVSGVTVMAGAAYLLGAVN